jgi:hypothetical protein
MQHPVHHALIGKQDEEVISEGTPDLHFVRLHLEEMGQEVEHLRQRHRRPGTPYDCDQSLP